ITAVSDFLWGYPVVIILLLTSIYLTVKLKFFQFRYPAHIFKQTVGQIGKKTKGDGTVTPFQTLTTALSSTIVAATLVGAPVAIRLGGAGAVCWMGVRPILARGLKFGGSTLGVYYREKNAIGEYVGAPTYYMNSGIK